MNISYWRTIFAAGLFSFGLLAVAIAEEQGEDESGGATWTEADCETWTSAAQDGTGKGSSWPWPNAFETMEPLVTCGAVALNSDAPCGELLEDPGVACATTVAMFQELRSEPKGRGFVFTAEDYEKCKGESAMAAHCDAIREAALSSDPDKCPAGQMEGFCRALVSLDASLCAKIKDPPGADKECRMQIARVAHYGGGIDGLKNGDEPMRSYAKAATDGKSGCDGLAKAAADACKGSVPKVEAPPTQPEPPAPGSDEPADDGEAAEDPPSAQL